MRPSPIVAVDVVAEQVIRPTGLLDPPITVKPPENQIDDIMKETLATIAKNERILMILEICFSR